jgi:hypothetical protein
VGDLSIDRIIASALSRVFVYGSQNHSLSGFELNLQAREAQFRSVRSGHMLKVRLVASSSKLLLEAQTAESTASAYSDKVLSRFALLFRRSVGGKIQSAARRLTSSVARSKAIMTTGRFTADAEAASIKKGAISLLLLDGDAIAESMIRNGIGVVRRPVQLFDLDPEFFRFPAADGLL